MNEERHPPRRWWRVALKVLAVAAGLYALVSLAVIGAYAVMICAAPKERLSR